MAKRKFDISSAEREKLKFSAMYMGATGSGKNRWCSHHCKRNHQGNVPRP
jgi:hypothetical protein